MKRSAVFIDFDGTLLTTHTAHLVGRFLRDLARAFAGLHGIDLESSYSYGNNEADRAILSMVGNPVAVEPTKRLEAMAQANGWKIVNH